jgi:hypothetical protein
VPKHLLLDKYHVDVPKFQWKEYPKALQQTKTKLPMLLHKPTTVAIQNTLVPAIPRVQNNAKTTKPNKIQNVQGF